jgi:hypothetical protein
MRGIRSPPADQTGLRRRSVRKVISELLAFMMLMSGILVWLGGQKDQSIRHHAAVSRSFAGASKGLLGFGDAGPVSKGGRTCRVNGSIPTPGGSDVISVGRLVREQNVGLLEATTYAGVAAMCRR